jgi:hypothetical protein
MSSTCTIVIPLSDLGFDDDYNTAMMGHSNMHNIDINIDNPKVKECDISLLKDNQTIPLNANHIQNSDTRNMSQHGGWWRTNAKTQTSSPRAANNQNESGNLVVQSRELIIPDLDHIDHVHARPQTSGHSKQSKWLSQSSDWTRSHSVDGSTDPNEKRFSRERQRIADRMRSLSLERSHDCWGRKRGVSVEDEVITHGEAPIHNAAKSVIKQVGKC